MMIYNRGNIFIYAILISFFATVIGYIVIVKMDILTSNIDLQYYDTKLHANIGEKATFALGYTVAVNSNGSGFINTLACPATVTLSGTLSGGASTTVQTAPFFNGSIFTCSGSTLDGNILTLSYSSGGNIFVTGDYLGSNIPLQPINGTGVRTGLFSDALGTYISFTAPGILSNIDLNANSDNFQPSSLSGVMYPYGYTDDDDLARKIIYGYIKKNTGWYNAFSINTPIRKYIESNIFNSGSNSIVASNVQTGYLRIDIDNPYNIKILEFNKINFDATKELLFITGTTASFSTGGIGYITTNMSLSGSKTQAKYFDLKNKDYAIFLSFSGNLTNTGIEFLKYKITMENENGTGVYITPINDSEIGILKYLGTDIIIDSDNNYRYKQFEKIQQKNLAP